MKFEDNNELLYIYILGQGNIYNGKNDAVSSLVPYKLNDDELFFGPCKKRIREEIKKNFLKEKDYINLLTTKQNIYIVGINPNLPKKDNSRRLLFAGKIKEIVTFKHSWNKYKKLAKNDEDIYKMINGSNEEIYGCGQVIEDIGEMNGEQNYQSPLHLIPVKKGNIEGYKHRTSMHKHNWITDILSDKELERYKTERKIKGDIKGFLEMNKINEIYKTKGIEFQRDCCFSLENIFFSDRNNPSPISVDERLLNLIVMGLKNPKGADLKSPFGYTKNAHKYGRGYVKIAGDGVTEFMNILYERLDKIKK